MGPTHIDRIPDLAMKLVLVNLYPHDTIAQYQLSSYVLKGYIEARCDRTPGVSVEVVNFSREDGAKEICDTIVQKQPDHIGYSCYVWNIEKIIEVVRLLRQTSKHVHIFGGPEISMSRIQTIPHGSQADYYVLGEGERRLLNLLNYLDRKARGEEVGLPKGIAKWENGKIVYEDDNDRITDLDEIPSVYLTGVLDEGLYARQQAFMETQRGCRFRCKYCVYHKNLSSISYYSLQRVYDELDHLIVRKQVMALRIFDAVFPSDLERAKHILRYLQGIKEQGKARLPWIFLEFRHERVDEEYMGLTASLKSRGGILNSSVVPALDRPQFYSDLLDGYTVIHSVGVESCDANALHAVGRHSLDRKQFADFVELSTKYNVVLKIDLILGLPLETLDSYLAGLEFLIPFFRNTDHVLNIHRLQVIPGCGLEDDCDKYAIQYSKEAPHLVSSTGTLSKEQMAHASKMSAVLFRVLNSPLREQFYKARDRRQQRFTELASCILREIVESPALVNSKLVSEPSVDDDYWNTDIFTEIPSDSLTRILEK